MPLDSSSTLGGVGGGVLPESVPARRADTTRRASTSASSLSQKAAENTMGAYHNLERCQRWAVDPVDRGVHGGKRASVFPPCTPVRRRLLAGELSTGSTAHRWQRSRLWYAPMVFSAAF